MSSERWPFPIMPMWARWSLAIVVAVAVSVGIVIAVHRAGPDNTTSEAGAEAEVNRVADIAITEDQEPHSATLPAGVAPVLALEQAIASDVRRRISATQLTGPLQGVTCEATGVGSAGRNTYRCSVRSADIAYPFLAVLDASARRLTWCKIDVPPTAHSAPEIPISTKCRAG